MIISVNLRYFQFLSQGLNAQLRFSIQDGADSNKFHIDHQSGKISTAAVLDREEKDFYKLIVMVQDMDGNKTLGTVLNDTATVFITVQVKTNYILSSNSQDYAKRRMLF